MEKSFARQRKFIEFLDSYKTVTSVKCRGTISAAYYDHTVWMASDKQL